MSELVDKLFAVHDALKAESLPHAFGGAIALAYCVEEPRGTRDLDVNIFCDAADAERVLKALPEGVRVGADDVDRVKRDGQARLFWDGVPIDVSPRNQPPSPRGGCDGRSSWVWMPRVAKAPMLDCCFFGPRSSRFFGSRPRTGADIEAVGDGELRRTIAARAASRRTLADLVGGGGRVAIEAAAPRSGTRIRPDAVGGAASRAEPRRARRRGWRRSCRRGPTCA